MAKLIGELMLISEMVISYSPVHVMYKDSQQHGSDFELPSLEIFVSTPWRNLQIFPHYAFPHPPSIHLAGSCLTLKPNVLHKKQLHYILYLLYFSHTQYILYFLINIFTHTYTHTFYEWYTVIPQSQILTRSLRVCRILAVPSTALS